MKKLGVSNWDKIWNTDAPVRVEKDRRHSDLIDERVAKEFFRYIDSPRDGL
jgi:hypothetical protein